MDLEQQHYDRSWGMVALGLIANGLLLAMLTIVGADLMWLVALGDHIRASGFVPDAVPFAAAAVDSWPPVLVAAQLSLSVIHEAGSAGLLVWHYLAVLGALVLVAVDARRRGAGDLATGFVLVGLVVGGASTFGVVRLQTFSLVPFALTLLLVRSQHRNPGRAMWWAPVLIAVWGNLHGTVLLGVCVIGAYLLFSRLARRPVETVLLGVATLAALFVNPATWRTPEYYLGVLHNQAAARGEGLWAAPDLADPFDRSMLVAVGVLGLLALCRRCPLWEYVAFTGLAIATVVAARNGVWLLLLLAPAAARGLAAEPSTPPRLGLPRASGWITLLLLLSLGTGLLVHRGQELDARAERLAEAVKRVAPGRVVLAPEPVVEDLAVHGVRVWLSNPLDAFRAEDQRAYLDFMAGRPGMSTAVAASDAVLVLAGSPAGDAMAQMSGFEVHELPGSWRMHVRR